MCAVKKFIMLTSNKRIIVMENKNNTIDIFDNIY